MSDAAWNRHQAKPLSSVMDLPGVTPIGEIDFSASGNAAGFTLEGWGETEARWTWTVAPVARLRLPQTGMPGVRRCSVRLLPFTHPPYLLHQRLIVTCAGVTLYSDVLDQPTEIAFDLPSTMAPGDDEALEFHSPQCVAPVAIGAGADPRLLGLRLSTPAALPPAIGLAAARAEGPPHSDRPETDVPHTRYGGIDRPIFETTSDIAAFTHGSRLERLCLFGALKGPDQIAMYRQERFAPDFIAEHNRYPDPPDVCVYSLTNSVLWGNGLLTRDGRFVLPSDCMPGYFSGYVKDDSHSFPEFWSGPIDAPACDTIRIDGDCALVIHPNMVYGHFLLEALPKLFLLGMLRDLGMRFTVPVSTRTPGWVRDFIDLYVPQNEILSYDMTTQNVVADRFIMPSMMHTDHNFHPAFNLMITDLLSRAGVAPPRRANTNANRIYLSRRQVRKGWHYLANEDAVERVMAEMGFTIVHPQTMSLPEQLAMCASADVIAGEYGSALHNAMFCRAGAKVISLNCINWYQSVIGRMRRHKIAYVPPSDGVFRTWRGRGKGDIDFEVDTTLLREIVAEVLADRDEQP